VAAAIDGLKETLPGDRQPITVGADSTVTVNFTAPASGSLMIRGQPPACPQSTTQPPPSAPAGTANTTGSLPNV